MPLRPVPARWFELLAARDDLEPAVEALGGTGAVELQIRGEAPTRKTLPDLKGRLDEYGALAQRYQAFWPHEDLRPSAQPGPPTACLDSALADVRAWAAQADPLVARLQALEALCAELRLLSELLEAYGKRAPDLAALAAAGPVLSARLMALPAATRLERMPAEVLYRRVVGREHLFLLVVGEGSLVEGLEQALLDRKGRVVALPDWLPSGAGTALTAIGERRRAHQAEADGLRERLEALGEEHDLHRALADVARLEWFVTQVPELPVSEDFAWVSGWTSDMQGKTLQAALDARQVRALLRFPPAPRDQEPPMVLDNPPWARPFELFARLLGMPGRYEADPSRVLAFIAPLLFGYMFGDVGQGLVLLLAGLYLRREMPILALLVPGGVTAMAFGLAFGSVFGREDWLPALWLHPMAHPLPVLLVPLAGGAAILLVGLLLNGLEAAWRGDARTWWRVDAAVLVLYVTLLTLALGVHPDIALAVASLALVWYLVGSAWGKGPMVLAGAAGRLLESGAQLAVNTLSFARVGAFALAHAGLSAAVVGLAEATGSALAGLLVLVVGNAFVILLEGLVVSVQTTRLVLFEFFIRFLHGEGRVFRPLPAPPAAHPDSRR